MVVPEFGLHRGSSAGGYGGRCLRKKRERESVSHHTQHHVQHHTQHHTAPHTGHLPPSFSLLSSPARRPLNNLLTSLNNLLTSLNNLLTSLNNLLTPHLHAPDDLSGDALPFLVLTRFHPFHVRVRFCVAPLVDDRIRTDVGADIQLKEEGRSNKPILEC